MKCCINGTFVTRIKYHVRYAIEHSERIHCDVIWDCIQTNEFSNVNIASKNSRAKPISKIIFNVSIWERLFQKSNHRLWTDQAREVHRRHRILNDCLVVQYAKNDSGKSKCFALTYFLFYPSPLNRIFAIICVFQSLSIVYLFEWTRWKMPSIKMK